MGALFLLELVVGAAPFTNIRIPVVDERTPAILWLLLTAGDIVAEAVVSLAAINFLNPMVVAVEKRPYQFDASMPELN